MGKRFWNVRVWFWLVAREERNIMGMSKDNIFFFWADLIGLYFCGCLVVASIGM